MLSVAEEKKIPEAAANIIADKVEIPNGFVYESSKNVYQDGRSLTLIRFERESGANKGIGGEHFSVLIDLKENRIDGVMHIDVAHTEENFYTNDQARVFTIEFLKKAAPELADRAEIKWIAPLRKMPIDEPHDTPYPFFNQKIGVHDTVVGMRVKLYDPITNGYGWVICNGSGKLVAFERDIGWDRIRKCRTTEQWLHDSWVMKWHSN